MKHFLILGISSFGYTFIWMRLFLSFACGQSSFFCCCHSQTPSINSMSRQRKLFYMWNGINGLKNNHTTLLLGKHVPSSKESRNEHCCLQIKKINSYWCLPILNTKLVTSCPMKLIICHCQPQLLMLFCWNYWICGCQTLSFGLHKLRRYSQHKISPNRRQN